MVGRKKSWLFLMSQRATSSKQVWNIEEGHGLPFLWFPIHLISWLCFPLSLKQLISSFWDANLSLKQLEAGCDICLNPTLKTWASYWSNVGPNGEATQKLKLVSNTFLFVTFVLSSYVANLSSSLQSTQKQTPKTYSTIKIPPHHLQLSHSWLAARLFFHALLNRLLSVYPLDCCNRSAQCAENPDVIVVRWHSEGLVKEQHRRRQRFGDFWKV